MIFRLGKRCPTLSAGMVGSWGGIVWAQGPVQPWERPAQAGPLYWFLVALVGGALLGFALWTLYGRMRPGEPATGRYHALGALVLVMTLFTLALYVIPALQAMRLAPSARAWDWRPGQALKDPGGSELQGEPYRGYSVYLAQGCTYCHTLYLRPQDIATGWGEGAMPEEVSQIGDYVHYPFTLLGTQRDGPDLSVVGRKIPDMRYHIDHLADPRRFKPRSVMPTYRYLSERDLKDLAAFLVSLGNPPEALRAGTLIPEVRPGLSELAQKGRQLYRDLACVSCHSVDGSPNAGPTWLGLWGSERPLEDGTVVIADEDYIEESILNPAAKVVQGFPDIMPSFRDRVSEEDIHALAAYIESLAEP